MKKLVLKLSVLVMVLTLVTLPLVSGTYAKYATQKIGSDTARVAKWGVVLTMASELDTFNLVYTPDDADTTVTNSVKAAANVVAPGTTGSFSFSLAGTPEVAVDLQFVVTATSDISLAAGNYNGVTIAAPYNPILFNVVDGNDDPVGDSDMTLAEFKAAIEDLSVQLDPAAPIDLENTYTVTWEWPFESSFQTGTDVTDYFVLNGAIYEPATGVFVLGTTYYENLAEGTPVYTVVATSLFLPATSYDVDDTDKLDTYLGDQGTQNLTFTVAINVIQID